MGQYEDRESGSTYNNFRTYDHDNGQYLEVDPIGQRGGWNLYSYAGGNPLAELDPLGLIEGSPQNLLKRKKLDQIARGYFENTAWAFNVANDNFEKNTNKCNKFVYDVTKEANAIATMLKRPALASELADPSIVIQNWRPLKPHESYEPGDIASYKESGGGIAYSGHTGFIVTNPETGGTTNISAHFDAVYPKRDQFEGRRSTTYRRYTGE